MTSAAADSPPQSVEDEELASVQSEGLGALFGELGLSMLVSTYQAAKLIVARQDASGLLNTHYRTLRKPMGIAVGREQVAVGVAGEIVFYSNTPANCAKLPGDQLHDACYVPRYKHITGDIDIHEMAFDGAGQPWFINTRFSALCTLNGMNSFLPVWRPPFITAYEPEDRCHLNGLALVDGRPRFVTALGQSDQRGGWRERKADGGVLMDMASNKVIVGGLSMPHSPRWYRGELWVCESGKGLLSRVDLRTGALQPVFEFPGFTRGLDFFGPYAFVGLSKIRETSTFSGIPIAERAAERNCGVWIIDLRTRSLVGLLRFTQGVHEIFSVQLLVGTKFPEFLDQHDALALETYFLAPEVMRQTAAARDAAP